MVNCIDFGLKFAPSKYQKIKNTLLRRARMALKPLKYIDFSAYGKVNALYFWTKVGAEKSVKYNVLTRLAPFAVLAAHVLVKFV